MFFLSVASSEHHEDWLQHHIFCEVGNNLIANLLWLGLIFLCLAAKLLSILAVRWSALREVYPALASSGRTRPTLWPLLPGDLVHYFKIYPKSVHHKRIFWQGFMCMLWMLQNISVVLGCCRNSLHLNGSIWWSVNDSHFNKDLLIVLNASTVIVHFHFLVAPATKSVSLDVVGINSAVRPRQELCSCCWTPSVWFCLPHKSWQLWANLRCNQLGVVEC